MRIPIFPANCLGYGEWYEIFLPLKNHVQDMRNSLDDKGLKKNSKAHGFLGGGTLLIYKDLIKF